MRTQNVHVHTERQIVHTSTANRFDESFSPGVKVVL